MTHKSQLILKIQIQKSNKEMQKWKEKKKKKKEGQMMDDHDWEHKSNSKNPKGNN